MPALIVRDGPAAGSRIEIEGEVILGRETTEYLQQDGEVSRRHAVVRSDPGGVTIEDLGSANGTFVNEVRIESATPLNGGDTLRIGQTNLEVEVAPAERGTIVREVPSTPPTVTSGSLPPVGAEPAGPGPLPAATPPYTPVGPPPAEQTAPPYVPGGPPPEQTGPPMYGGPPPGTAGGKSGLRTAATIVLIAAGALGLIFQIINLLDIFGTISDAREIEQFLASAGLEENLSGPFVILAGIGVLLMIAHILQLVAGILFVMRRPAARVLGIVSSAVATALWIIFLIVAFMNEISVGASVWIFLIITILLSGTAIGLAAAAGRQLAMPPGWAPPPTR